MSLRVGKVAHIGRNLTIPHEQLLGAIARGAEQLTFGKGWPDGVLDLLEELGKITGVSRVWIFQTLELGEHYIIQDYPFEWADETGHAQLHLPRFNMWRNEIADPMYRQLIESRQRGEYQSVIASELPEGWLKKDQERQGILSMLTIPLMVDGEWWGTLGFDDCRREYRWSDAEIALLRTASYLISNAVTREKLAAKTRQFDILQSMTESSAWELDLKNGHFWCNSELLTSDALQKNIHMSAREILRMLHPEDLKALLSAFRHYLLDTVSTFRIDVRIAADCGQYIWVEIIGSFSLDSGGRPVKIAGIAIEIRKRKQLEENLRHQASMDPLTGIGNRSVFDIELSRLLQDRTRKGSSIALLVADLDHFKMINDQWGHIVGDKALRHFVSICRTNLRQPDKFSRIGGEEFAILLENIDDATARAIGERIRKDVAETPLKADGHTIPFTVSIGYVLLTADDGLSSFQELYDAADQALYQAKRAGRNCVRTIPKRTATVGGQGCSR